MRKDKGLNGDLDRLPMLTWIMFLKFLDDMERHEEEARTWRARTTARPSSRRIAGATGRRTPTGSPGRTCCRFINRDEADRPDGTRGPGLFAYLRALAR